MIDKFGVKGGKDNVMGNLGESYYKRGMCLFQLKQYEEAVVNWIQAYDLGYVKEAILENIYNCFVIPNQEQFRDNYKVNADEFSNLLFEECTLDFIPVTENRFYIFDKEEQIFRGSIDLKEFEKQGRKAEFHNILYTDTWDVREILPDMREKDRDTVYVLLNDLENKFVSFFKLPKFKEEYMQNVVVFKNETLLRAFFREYEEVYLPKQLVTSDAERYGEMIGEIHRERVHQLKSERKNIFLSICIPSYNRGKLALRQVRHILSLMYDSEIEIIVSNNGSIKEVEDYEKIRDIQDSRVRYHAFAENQGYAENILKVCDLARGKYAILASDEDVLILENFEPYLNFIKEHPNCGVFSCSVFDNYLWKEDMVFEKGLTAILMVSTCSYITGLTFHMGLCRHLKLLDMIERARKVKLLDWKDDEARQDVIRNGNLPLETLTHDFLMSGLCCYGGAAFTSLPLWDAKVNSPSAGNVFNWYFMPETRIANQNGFIDFCCQVLRFDKASLISVFVEKCKRTHYLLRLSYLTMPDDMLREVGPEWEVQAWVYRQHMRYLDAFPMELTEEEYDRVCHYIARYEAY